MTSKAVISQLEVNERRLKGIYDQLEGGNYKKAIFEADKVLKKNSNLLPAKVLKGLALYRLGKPSEAHNLIDEIAKLTPTDENTLNSLSYFYKESNQKSKIVEMYEEAYKKCPTREDICANLFYCHTKNFDFLSQQKVATQLKKINANHMEYVMWPIISNVLYGVYNKDERLIKLGEAVLARYLKSNSILTVEIIEFFMFTLEKLNKLEECLDWLNGLVLKDVIESNQNKELFNRYKISYLLKLNKKFETCELFWEFLQNNRDDVCMWRDYIDVVVDLNLDSNSSHSILAVIDKLKSSTKPNMAVKVASIHLSWKLETAQHSLSSEFGSMVDKITDYFIEFADKPSCLYDVYSFMGLDAVSDENRHHILKKINDFTGPLSIDTVTNTKQIEMHVTAETLKRAVSSSDQCAVSHLITMYDHGIQFSTTISSSEIKPCDNFARLAASRYYDDWLDNEKLHCKPIIEAIVLLKRAIDLSPANYNLRLQLSHLFGMLACPDLLIGQFNELEVKQLMWDSLGYFFILPILSVPCFQQRVQFFKQNIDRRGKNKLEIEDSLVTCYKLGNYSRIPEIIELHRDIGSSVMSRLCEMEILYVNTILKSNNCDDLFDCFSNIDYPEIESSDPELDLVAHYSNLKDFRNLKTSPDFTRFDRMWGDQDQDLSFSNILLWTCQRVIVVRAFYSAAKLTMETVVKLDRLISDPTTSFTKETSLHQQTLQTSCRLLQNTWDQMGALTGSYQNLSANLTGCPEPPQGAFSKAYIETIVGCITSMIQFHDTFVSHSMDNGTSLTDWTTTIFMPLNSVMNFLVNDEIGFHQDNVFVQVPLVISKLTLVCELFSLVTLTLALVENMTKPLRPKVGMKRRNKKKKAESIGDSSTDSKGEQLRSFLESTNFHRLLQLFIDTAVTLDTFVARVKDAIGSIEFTDVICANIAASWKSSLDDAVSFVNVKKTHLEQTRKIFDEESVAHQCLCQMNELTVVSENHQ